MLERYRFDLRRYLPILNKPKFVLANEDRLVHQIKDENEAKGFGHGFPYTAELAQALLDWPYSNAVSLLSEKGEKLYKSKRNGSRVKFGQVNTHLIDQPFWYFQGDEPTCTAWALASIALSMGNKLDGDFMASLLNEANGIQRGDVSEKNDNKPGIDAKTLEKIVNSEERSIRVSLVLENWPERETYPSYLSSIVSGKGAIIETVDCRFYNRPRLEGLHNIAIVGVQSSPRGEVDLQVLDSNIGEVFVPAEFVYSCRKGDLMVIRGQ